MDSTKVTFANWGSAFWHPGNPFEVCWGMLGWDVKPKGWLKDSIGRRTSHSEILRDILRDALGIPTDFLALFGTFRVSHRPYSCDACLTMLTMLAKPLGPTVFALLPSQTGPPHPKGWRCGLGAFSHAYNGGHRCKGLRFYPPRIVDLSQGRRQRVDRLWRAGRDGNGHTGESSDERSKKTNKTEVQRANCVESRMPDTNQQ